MLNILKMNRENVINERVKKHGDPLKLRRKKFTPRRNAISAIFQVMGL
jgi:hypothetical protein